MIRVAVRTLCHFAARSGDLDHRYTPSPSAIEGIQGHRAVAANRHGDYRTEVPLAGTCKNLAIAGRADGYDPRLNQLEEIKTCRGDVSRINPDQKQLHWAQLKVYGALMCRQHKLAAIRLSLVYFNVASERETAETVELPADDLWDFLEDLCRAYGHWAEQEANHRRARDIALAALAFPFPEFRRGQRPMAESAYKAVMTGRPLFLEAPTGIGKTLGTLYPALLALPRRGLDRLYFLSARNTGRSLALAGFRQLLAGQETGAPLRVLELSARQQVCVHPDRACHGESCPLARGFYDRLGDARQAAMDRGGVLDQEAVAEIAARFRICPYYLTQELARWCDAVVADVNYYFDQHAMLFALARENDWKVTLLVDEAHNLPDRARGMYSVSLSQGRLLALKKRVPPELKRPLAALARGWRELVKNHLAEGESGRFSDTLPTELTGPLQRVVSAITDYLTDHEADSELQELMFEAMGFNRLAETFAAHSICEIRRPARGRASLAIHNLIPAEFLRPRFQACRGAVLFSATLTPAHFYRDLLGVPGEPVFQRVESPFQGSQLDLSLCAGISTRFRDRDRSIAPAADRISSRYRRRPANYLVYLSSFAYLDALYRTVAERAPGIPLCRQTPAMPEEERRQFLDGFREGGRQVGFAVLGGVFSEGIDLPGNRLHGAFVLTLGLPPHDEFNEILRRRLEQRFGRGYEYTYLFPGLRKVVQAAGRVIRTPADRGFIELIDDRFNRAEVRRLLPAWWPPPTRQDGKMAE